MGVTLERVQNKFACIIGELCNEPYVLSQFAIWVDLRFAEYKANGAIQLDCTGSVPEPTWLKGMKPPVTAQSDPLPLHGSPGSANRNGRQRHQGFDSSQTWPSSEILHNPTSESRLDDDFEIVEVKEEPQDFPSSLFTSNRSNRKRNSMDQNQDFLKSDNTIFPTHSPKIRRLSSASESTFNISAHDPATHQSFMSVIGISDQPSTSADNTSTIQTQDSISEYQKGNVSAEYGYDNRLNASSSVSTDSDMGTGCTLQQSGLRVSIGGQAPVYKAAFTTSVNTRSAVKLFQSWLWSSTFNDTRMIEEIPPTELDERLSAFWMSVRRRSGDEYQPKSLRLLRTRLERHLRDSGYPMSIVNTPLFDNSREAFNQRLAMKIQPGPMSEDIGSTVDISDNPLCVYNSLEDAGM